MKILLDECLPFDFRHSFPEHTAHTAEWAGFKGKKNGELLRACAEAGYEVLLTTDRGFGHQQNVAASGICVLVIRAETNRMKDLRPLASAIQEALLATQPGQVVIVG